MEDKIPESDLSDIWRPVKVKAKKPKPPVPLPDDKKYDPTTVDSFPDSYYIGIKDPQETDEAASLLAGTTQWYNTGLDVVFRWTGRSWEPSPYADKWVVDANTGEVMGRVTESASDESLTGMSLDDLAKLRL
jgi:hypothetical protein